MPRFARLLPGLIIAAVAAGCSGPERCDVPTDGKAYEGVYKPVRLKDGESLAGYQSCQRTRDCPTATTCSSVYFETCFSEKLCGITAEFECPEGYRVAVLESDPAEIVCRPNP